MPGFLRKLKRRPKLQLIGVSSPGIEKISSPTVRRNQHVLDSLTVSVAIESRIPKYRIQESTRTQLVVVGDPNRYSILSIIGRRGLRNERVDICEPPAQWENVEIHVQKVARR